VQECLTNARRHAPGQPVTVRLEGRPGRELVVRVENPVVGPGGSGGSDGSPAVTVAPGGLGLDGLAERARLVGGRLTVDSSASRHVVEARLPWTR
jgi:signal transduction histidine kinase